MEFETDEDARRLVWWQKVLAIALMIIAVPVGLFGLAGSALLLTFGPGDFPGRWTVDHLLILQTPFYATLVAVGAGISLHTGRLRLLFGASLLVGFAVLLTLMMA